jgi:predicted O-methyltransferase YrrM
VRKGLAPLGDALRSYRDHSVLRRSSAGFEPALDAAMRIPGFTSPIELSFLYHAGLALPGRGHVVEIGSYLGRSTVILARAAADAGRGPVIAVDPHTGDLTHPDVERLDTREQFLRNMEAAGVADQVDLVQETSIEAAQGWPGDPVELFFVDGLHTYDAVLADVQEWSRFLVGGACVVLDDYLVYPEVRSAVRELRGGGWLEGAAAIVGKMIAFAHPHLLARLPMPPGARVMSRLGDRSIDRLNRVLDWAFAQRSRSASA